MVIIVETTPLKKPIFLAEIVEFES